MKEDLSAQATRKARPKQANRPTRPRNQTPDTLEKLRRWDSYVAIGDSFTEGMADPVDPDDPNNLMFGWADRLAWELSRRRVAAGLEPLKYANLAIRGRKLTQVAAEQVAPALQMQPALLSIVAGGNDLVRVPRDPDRLSRLLESIVVSAREAGCDVLMGTIQDSKGSPIISSMRPYTAEFNANIWSIAQRHGCYVLDQWGLRPIRTMNPWADDRFHLRAVGHEIMMNHALRALGLEPNFPEYDQMFHDSGVTRWSFRQNRDWAKNHLWPWVKRHARGRSSGDGRVAKFPQLTVLDPAELPTPPISLR